MSNQITFVQTGDLDYGKTLPITVYTDKFYL